MPVILFHNNDEILLRKYQKEFIRLNNKENNILLAAHVLRPVLNTNLVLPKEASVQSQKQYLKDISRTIQNITLERPVWNNQSQTLECNVVYTFTDNTPQDQKLCLIQTLNPQKKIAGNELTFPATSMFPKTIKTFRLGNQIIIDKKSSAISASVWH